MSSESDVLAWPDGSVVDVESITHHAENARLLCSALDDGQVRTPDWVIAELAVVSKTAARMVLVIQQAEAYKRAAATALERKRANLTWDNRTFPATVQRSRVILGSQVEKDDYDAAVVAFEYARRVGNLLKDYTGRVQSIGKQVELTYRGGA